VGGYHIANVYKPPTEHWNNTSLSPVLPHPAVLVGDFKAIIETGDIRRLI